MTHLVRSFITLGRKCNFKISHMGLKLHFSPGVTKYMYALADIEIIEFKILY